MILVLKNMHKKVFSTQTPCSLFHFNLVRLELPPGGSFILAAVFSYQYMLSRNAGHTTECAFLDQLKRLQINQGYLVIISLIGKTPSA